MFNARHTKSHSPHAFLESIAGVKRRNPSTCLIQPCGRLRQPLAIGIRRPSTAAVASFLAMRLVAGCFFGSRVVAVLPSRGRCHVPASTRRVSRSTKSRSLQYPASASTVSRLRVERRIRHRVEQHRQPALVTRVRRHLRRRHQLVVTVDRHLRVIALLEDPSLLVFMIPALRVREVALRLLLRLAIRPLVRLRRPSPVPILRPAADVPRVVAPRVAPPPAARSRRPDRRTNRSSRSPQLRPPTRRRAPPPPSARPRPFPRRLHASSAAVPRSRRLDAVPPPASDRSSSPCACSRSRAPSSRRSTTSRSAPAPTPAPDTLPATNSFLKSAKCRRRITRTPSGRCGKLPAASTRNATSSSSFRVDPAARKTPGRRIRA